MDGKKSIFLHLENSFAAGVGAVNNHIILKNKKSPDGVVPTRTFVAILLSGDA